jgi:chromosome segregation ATPase
MGGLKGIFWKGKDEEAGQSNSGPTFLSKTPTAVPSSGDSAINAVQVNEEYRNNLMSALSRAKTRGYAEFIEMMKTLAEGVSDEAKLFVLTQKAIKLSREQILASLAERKAILEGERKTFDEDVSNEVDSIVTANNQELGTIATQIDEKTKAIEALQGEISSLGTKRSKLSNEIAEIQRKKTQKMSEFNVTVQMFLDELAKLSAKIESYLK